MTKAKIEQGITVRTGAHALRQSLFLILQNRSNEISPRMNDLIVGLYEEWQRLDDRLETTTGEIEMISKREVYCQRLMSVPGIGPIKQAGYISTTSAISKFSLANSSRSIHWIKTSRRRR